MKVVRNNEEMTVIVRPEVRIFQIDSTLMGLEAMPSPLEMLINLPDYA